VRIEWQHNNQFKAGIYVYIDHLVSCLDVHIQADGDACILRLSIATDSYACYLARLKVRSYVDYIQLGIAS
jgi:hypothetical protein